MAGWSRSSTFERFYHKPTLSNNIGLVFEPYIVIYSPCPDVELLILQASEGCDVRS